MKLAYTRGLPGSGKTRAAFEWLEKNPDAIRINNDDLRYMFSGAYWSNKALEKKVRAMRNAFIHTALAQGHSVIVDNTHLPESYEETYRQIALQHGAKLEVIDLRDVPLEVCIERNYKRDRVVPEKVIRDMYRRFIKQEPEPWPRNPNLPDCIIVDLDGTLAIRQPGPDGTIRGSYDWDRVGEDRPNWVVIDYLYRLIDEGEFNIVFMSGRDEICREETMAWLDVHSLASWPLHMRGIGDRRKDSIVKRELFSLYVADKYNPILVLDDRQQVVDMWREMGLTVWQVAEGDF